MIHYCVSFTGLQEIAIQDSETNPRWKKSIDQIVQDAFYKSKIRTPRSKPQKIECVVSKLQIDGLQLVRIPLRTLMVTPPLEAMNEDEFQTALNEVLEDVPDGLKQFVRSKSWEDGHSSGYEEVVNCAINLASELKNSASMVV